MAIDYVMPKLAMAMNEGTINEWLVAEGDYVEKGQVLANVETEKVAYEVESPDAGYFHILVPVGETVDCESLIAQFAETEDELQALQSAVTGAEDVATTDGDESSPPLAVSSNVVPVITGGRVIASPLAWKIAADSGLDLHGHSGSGPGGRIVKRDVLAILEQGVAATAVPGGSREIARIPMTGMRGVIAERMVESLQQAAQLSSSWESDISDLLLARKKLVAREEQLGTRVSVNAFIARAMVYAIRQVSIANSTLQDDEIVIHENVNLGIAVSMPGTTDYDSGLMVAVLRNVEQMGIAQIDRDMKSLIERVRNGKAGSEDLSGSTITLSSTAGIAPPGMTTTPVLNLPNAALVGPSTPVQRPVIKDGEMVVRTMMPVSFTFDHRVLDGEPAARFMNALHEALENPELLLI